MKEIAKMLYQAYLNERTRQSSEIKEKFFNTEREFLGILEPNQRKMYNKLESFLLQYEESQTLSIIVFLLTLLCPEE